jgi:hypothetical protein
MNPTPVPARPEPQTAALLRWDRSPILRRLRRALGLRECLVGRVANPLSPDGVSSTIIRRWGWARLGACPGCIARRGGTVCAVVVNRCIDDDRAPTFRCDAHPRVPGVKPAPFAGVDELMIGGAA